LTRSLIDGILVGQPVRDVGLGAAFGEVKALLLHHGLVLEAEVHLAGAVAGALHAGRTPRISGGGGTP